MLPRCWRESDTYVRPTMLNWLDLLPGSNMHVRLAVFTNDELRTGGFYIDGDRSPLLLPESRNAEDAAGEMA
jgi:hypothetical protein